jgi:very-short-patch-repair endonuclease
LTEFLLSHQIRYARAAYWDAYVVDFLSRERVIVGSDGPSRIPKYEDLVNEHRDAAVHIERQPCEGQLAVADWCIQLPVNRPAEGAR